MSAAEHLQEAIDVGCTRDDHDHVADHRAEVLAEAAGIGEAVIAKVPVTDEHLAFWWQDGARTYRDELLAMAGKDTGDAIQAPASESTQPEPDLFSRVHTALSAGQGSFLHLPESTVRVLTARVVDAITPLVPYRPVWDSSFPPGGSVCSICGDPVESEPCHDHAPDFFKPGRAYQRGRWTFYCHAVAPTPTTGSVCALGYLSRTDGTCTAHALGKDNWEHDGWIEQPEGEVSRG